MGEGLLKHAVGVWFRPPGPFTFAGAPDYQERLTGMSEWAPRKLVQRVSKGLQAGKSVDEVSRAERGHGLLRGTVVSTLMGGTGGGLLARVAGGQRSSDPFMRMVRRGVTKETLKGLGKVPGVSKALFAGGLAAGGLGSAINWKRNAGKREAQAREVSRGLLAERVLQRNALRDALHSEQPYNRPLLQGLPTSSATAQTPYAVTLSNSGL